MPVLLTSWLIALECQFLIGQPGQKERKSEREAHNYRVMESRGRFLNTKEA